MVINMSTKYVRQYLALLISVVGYVIKSFRMQITKPLEVVEEILSGKGFTMSGVFDLLDYDLRSQTTSAYNLLAASPDWETLKKVSQIDRYCGYRSEFRSFVT